MFNKKTVVEKHQLVSNSAFSVFTDTVDSLNKADEEISKDVEKATVKVLEAKNELDSLWDIKNKNNKLKNKINNFLKEF